ncbi:hypothetical protein G7054_g11167 [Neopestalotiopsis clavispora]|nr:hypothetical protein G7054_g11167 [Neopestalotiopsis clavispora]
MNGTNSTGDATGQGQARVGWVSPPNAGRSTWGIIWSCLAVFLLCSWKCTHLNVPTVEESEAGWHKIWCIPVFPEQPLLRKWGRKLFFMALIAIAPEIVVALAARQHLEARDDLRDVKLCSENMRKYTMAHAMFAHMGGFVVHYYDDPTTQEAETDHAQTPVVKEAIDTRSEALRKAMQNGDGKPSRAQSLSLSQVGVRAGAGWLAGVAELRTQKCRAANHGARTYDYGFHGVRAGHLYLVVAQAF